MGIRSRLRSAGLACASAVAIGGLLAAPVGVAAAGAATLYVSPTATTGAADTTCATAGYATINSAIAAAATGDTVIACAGTYKEDVAVSEALTLTGQAATIDATGLDNGVLITASNATVQGFTVENATGEGILAQQPSPVPGPPGSGLFSGPPITNVTIEHNTVKGNDLGGQTASTTTYAECQVSGNVPGDCGEGVHLWSVANSRVLFNTITQNAGGILLTDEFGPTYGNLIAGNVVSDNAFDCGITLASHNLAFNTTTNQYMPRFGGVYNNTIRNNVVNDNGVLGFGAGVGIFAPGPATAAYNNVVDGNAMTGNGLAGVTLHAHAPGAIVNGNTIKNNLIGPNNLDGDSDLSPTPDNSTTGIIVWSAATPVTVTITGNTILGNWYGIWINSTVNAPNASHLNTFIGVSTHVHKAS